LWILLFKADAFVLFELKLQEST